MCVCAYSLNHASNSWQCGKFFGFDIPHVLTGMNFGCSEVLLVIQLLPKRPSPVFFSPMQLMGSTTRADCNLWFQRHGRDRTESTSFG